MGSIRELVDLTIRAFELQAITVEGFVARLECLAQHSTCEDDLRRIEWVIPQFGMYKWEDPISRAIKQRRFRA